MSYQCGHGSSSFSPAAISCYFQIFSGFPVKTKALLQELDDYAPEPEVHKYLHSRLMHFDVPTLYEMHYNSITLGKVCLLEQEIRYFALDPD